MSVFKKLLVGGIFTFTLLGVAFMPSTALACTSLALKAEDGATVYGRTMEWGTFDLNSRLVIVPRGHEFQGHTPDGKPGHQWEAKYGVVALDMVEKDYFSDGMNEKGLVVGVLYHPGFAEYQSYDPEKANISMGPTDFPNYVLTQFATVEEVREGLKNIRVVPVPEPVLGGIPAPLHLMVVDKSGKAIVVEYLKGELNVFDNPLRVLTNAPSFDWHMTNLRNYVNLSAVALPAKKIEDLDFAPLGAGSGLIGIPGDYTPPSRFVRAVAYSQTARKTPNGDEAVYEVLRIMDNFNLPLGSAEGPDANPEHLKGMRSSTIWTSAADTRNLKYYYHTQHNRQVRMVDLKRIDFSPRKEGIKRFPLDRQKSQNIEDVTPQY
jgi:choloylglycine hydrolase